MKFRFFIFIGFFIVLGSCVSKKPLNHTSPETTSKKPIPSSQSPIDQQSDAITVKPSKDSVTFKMKEIEYAFQFQKSLLLSSVLDSARAQGKLVYLDLNVSWCITCKLMQRDVYTHKPTADFFNEHFISYMVDVEKEEGPDLKLIFDVHSLPTLLFLDSKGHVMHRTEGAKYHRELIENANIALSKVKDSLR